MKTCSIDGCNKKRGTARGWCHIHYCRWWRSKTPLYETWVQMKYRCHNKNHPAYSCYGGRGITVCDHWRDSFKAFLADMGPKPSNKHSLDRINNDGNYEPSNCRWATRCQQQRNTRMNRRNKIGITGVYPHRKNKWIASLYNNNKLKHLYSGPDFFEACCARKSAELKYWT